MQRDLVRKSARATSVSKPMRKARPAVLPPRSMPNVARRKPPSVSDAALLGSFSQRLMLTGLILLVLITTTVLGLQRILDRAAASTVPSISLVVWSPSVDWLIVEHPGKTAVIIPLAPNTQLDQFSGADGTTWNRVRNSALSADPIQKTQILSQLLGLPITAVLAFENPEASSRSECQEMSSGTAYDCWRTVRSELRRRWLSDFLNPATSFQTFKTWQVARIAGLESGDLSSTALIASRLSRLGMSSIPSGENCPVAVLNNARIPGLAGRISTVIEQNGGKVIRVGNALNSAQSEQETQDTGFGVLMITDPENDDCPYTATLIQQLFTEEARQGDERVLQQYRSSIVVRLGAQTVMPEVTAIVQYPRQ